MDTMTDKELDAAIIQSQNNQTVAYKAYCDAVRTTDRLKMIKRVRRINNALAKGKDVTVMYHKLVRKVTAVAIPDKITTPSGDVSNLINVTYIDKDGNDKVAKIDYHSVNWD